VSRLRSVLFLLDTYETQEKTGGSHWKDRVVTRENSSASSTTREADRASSESTTMPADGLAGQVLALQMAAGNQAVAALLRSRAATLARGAGPVQHGGARSGERGSVAARPPAASIQPNPYRRATAGEGPRGDASTAVGLYRTTSNAALSRLIARSASSLAEDTQVQTDFEAIKTELDRFVYSASVEEKVISILSRNAHEAAGQVAGQGRRLNRLDMLLARLRTTTKQTGPFDIVTSYYDLMFAHFDRGDELRRIRDQHSRLFVGEEPMRQPQFFGADKEDFFGDLWEDVKSGAVERRIYAYFRGLGEAGVGLAEGMAMLLDPNQWPKLAHAIGNVPTTAKILWQNREKFWNAFLAAKPEEQARIIGRVVGEIEIQLASLAVGAGPGKAATSAPALAEATVAVGRAGTAASTLSTGMTITIDLGKLGAVTGQSLILMSQVAEGATKGKEDADVLKAAEAEAQKGGKAGGGKTGGGEPPKAPKDPGPGYKPLSKAEFDKLSPAQRQEHLTKWMKAHNVERIVRSAKHHAWPEYLGGPAKQALLSLDELKHIKFHTLLDTVLPRSRGVAYYAARTPAQKAEDIATLRRIARDFDIEEGTKISEQLEKVLKGAQYAVPAVP
jgi:hypothetical protein